MDTTLTLTSPAKLNLFLHINGRREDGYHELQTVFQLLDYGDQMHFEANDSGQITVETNVDDIPLEDNLIYKALRSLQEATGTTKGVQITLEKRLPMGGGVGGGSSNAATALLALNKLWKTHLTIEELANLGKHLGADVPIFVRGKSVWAEGIGERIQEIDLPEKWFVVLSPDQHVSTAQIFSNQRLTRDTPKKKIAPALEAQGFESFHNDCEGIVRELFPKVDEAINWLNQHGQGRMTGTGACCFACFDSKQEAEQVLNEARSKFKGFIAKGVNLSPAHQRLNEAD